MSVANAGRAVADTSLSHDQPHCRMDGQAARGSEGCRCHCTRAVASALFSHGIIRCGTPDAKVSRHGQGLRRAAQACSSPRRVRQRRTRDHPGRTEPQSALEVPVSGCAGEYLVTGLRSLPADDVAVGGEKSGPCGSEIRLQSSPSRPRHHAKGGVNAIKPSVGAQKSRVHLTGERQGDTKCPSK